MRINGVIKRITLFVLAILLATSAFAEPSCTHTPDSITITAGGAPQTITYTCNGMMGLPPGRPFMLQFNASPNVQIAAPYMPNYPYTVQVSSSVPGNYAVTVSKVSVGGSWNPYVGTNPPLAMTVNPVPVPTVTGLSISSGPSAGGNQVTITGTNFTSAATVKFGDLSATGVTYINSTTLTATAPPGTGTVDVTVTTVNGTSATSPSDQYTYSSAPTVTSLSTNSGPTSGGTVVNITGTNFTADSTVEFGDDLATNVVYHSATSLTVTSPAGAGLVNVTVTTSGGVSAITSADQFTYLLTPTVTHLSVSSGPLGGGTSVTITGTNFTSGSTVKFGATDAASVTYNSATSLTATSPAGTGTVNVTVTTTGGTSATSSADQFTYQAVPTVTNLSVNTGLAAGGTSVTITGTNFTPAATVKFGTRSATGVTYNSATSLTVTSPSGTGIVNVTVTTVNGTSATVPADQFTYQSLPVPTVTNLSVSSGALSGGTSVTITGTNFTPAATVKFGTTNAASVTYNSATSLTVTSPAGTGTVDVRVTTTGGTSAASSADQFTYQAVPTITNLSVSTGPAVGGTSVTITGTNFTPAATVKFGTTNATSVTYHSATSVTATSPSGTGIVNVTVTTVAGTSAVVPADQFTYQATPVVPTVTSLSVSSGPLGGGTSVTIMGTNFTSSATVKFGTTDATSVTYNSATSLTVTSPAGTGTVNVTVTTAGGTSATSSADQFTYQAVPTITNLSVSTGPATGGTSVTITGTNFTPAATVKFGATNAASVMYNSATSLTVTSPAGTGIVNITVTTVDGTSAVVPADQFTYQATPAPSVTHLSVSSGALSGGTSVTITGTNFTSSATVKFGATNAASVMYNSATSLTVTSPAGTGTVDVTVTTAGGTSATSSADQFTYQAVPTVTNLSVSSGPTGGGTSVTITGTNFTSAATVKFGSTTATVVYNSATSLTATSPAGAGIVNVTVTTTGGTSATTSADQFTYLTGPSVTQLSVSAGPVSGNTSVIITGSNFTPAATVKFGATNAVSVTYNSSTSLTATSPAGTGTVDVTVTTTGGTSATSSADQFTYFTAPTVTNLSVGTGSASGGTSLTITGTNFTSTATTTVKFGTASATSVTVINSTTLSATSPAGSGTVDVTVTTPGGTSAITSADHFVYQPLVAPTVTYLSPPSGPTSTAVTITGTSFTPTATVKFGSTSATGVTYNSATSLSATAPAGTGVVDVTVTTAGGTSATSSADQFTYTASSNVTGVVQTNTQCTQVSFPAPVGGAGIICNVVYTNNGSTSISNPQFAGTILAPGAGTITPSSGQCPLLNSGGGSCTETYTFTTLSSTYPLPSGMQLIMQMGMSSSSGSLLASVNQILQFKPLVAVSNSAPWTCTPTQLVWGGTATCSLALNAIDSNLYPQHGVLQATTSAGGSFGSTTPQSIAFSSASPITKLFTYTAPTSGASQSISLGLNYSDEIGDALTIPPVSVTVGPPVTISGIRCNPNPAVASSQVSCNVILTNIGTSSITINTPIVSMGGQAVTPSAACLTNLAAGGNCTVTFGTTASSSGSMEISVAPASTGPGFQTQSTTLPIYSSSHPQIQADPIVCSIDELQLPIGGGANGSMHCSMLVSNLGSTQATNVTLTPTVSAGDGTITPDPTPMVCSNSTLGTMNQNDTCSAGFTYTTPSTPPNNTSALISVSYSDAQGGDTGSVAFLQPISVLLLNDPNALIAASVIPDTSNIMPANNVPYTSGSPVPVIFHFLNSTGEAIDYNTPVVVTVTNGVVTPVSPNAIDMSNSSCVTNSSLNKGAGCNLTVDFQPNLANGFKTGDRVAVMAWLPGSGEGDSLVANWNIAIGLPPIFAEVYTNSPFVAGLSNPNGFQGAFIFGNNSGATLTGVQAVRAFLPAGMANASSCFSGVAAKYPGIVSCGSLGGTMAANQSCYSCFTAALSSYPAQTSLSFQAELSYDQSASQSSRIVPVTPSYRTITLNNMCSNSVWPAFVSGAAYYSCTQDSDCPAGTVCYKPGSQCMVPPTQPFSPTTGCPVISQGPPLVGMYHVPSDFMGGGCSAGCNTANVGPGACPNLSSCNPSNGLCYWTLPALQSGSLNTGTQELPASTTAVMQIPNSPLVKNGDWSTVWSGGLIGRTGCVASGSGSTFALTCATGYCPANSDGTCQLGTAPQPPATQAEFTFLYTNQDYYDVEVINGFSIPTSMAPGSYALNPAPAVPTSPYICSPAGLQLTTNGLSTGNVNQCSWDYVMNSYDLLNSATATAYPAHFQALHTFVTDGGATCTPGATNACPTGPGQATQICGISMQNSVMTPSASPVPVFTCGSVIGFWSGNQICANNANLDYKDPGNAAFELNCAAQASTPQSPTTYGTASMQQWLGCNGGGAAGSCYAANAASGSCCGCPYWSAGVTGSPEKTTAPSTYFQTLFPSGFVLSPNGSDDYCQANSSAWTTHVQGPELTWMKQGCASVYTFAYDDPTSTFVCSSNSVVNHQVQNPQGKVNTQNYTVTFCPGTTASTNGYSGSVNGVPVDESATNSSLSMKSSGQKQVPSVSLWQFFSNHMHNLERRLYAN